VHVGDMFVDRRGGEEEEEGRRVDTWARRSSAERRKGWTRSSVFAKVWRLCRSLFSSLILVVTACTPGGKAVEDVQKQIILF
jgi:hypothetical protein